MDRSLLLRLPVLLYCIRGLSGSFLNRQYATQAVYESHLYIDKSHFFDIVQCRMCHIQFPGGRCLRGRGICLATTEEACTTGRVIKSDGTMWLTFMGCMKNCANVNQMKWNVYFVNFRCCRGYDFCNESL